MVTSLPEFKAFKSEDGTVTAIQSSLLNALTVYQILFKTWEQTKWFIIIIHDEEKWCTFTGGKKEKISRDSAVEDWSGFDIDIRNGETLSILELSIPYISL